MRYLLLFFVLLASSCQHSTVHNTKKKENMNSVVIYTKPICPYCIRAKQLLTEKGVEFTEINLLIDPEKREEMIQRSNRRTTVPQIFIGKNHIGGCDDLFALEEAKKLDVLLFGRQ